MASVAAVWFGFPMVLTQAVFGGIIVLNLGFIAGSSAILLGNLILCLYVGGLSYIAGATGRCLAIVFFSASTLSGWCCSTMP